MEKILFYFGDDLQKIVRGVQELDMEMVLFLRRYPPTLTNIENIL